MESNELLKDQIFDILNNQLKENSPPETKNTFNRLLNEGFDDTQAKEMIGQCIAVELFEIIKHGNKYDNTRYIKNLNNLPKETFD